MRLRQTSRRARPGVRLGPVAVVGMHRSGTSYVAGSLESAGLFLGEVSRWNPHNQRGNREHSRIVALNDAVLSDNGGAWDDPPPRVEWSGERLREAEQIATELGVRPQWGFKDPRTLLTLSGWREVVPDLRLVGTFRHPTAVIDSLQRRAEFGGTAMDDAQCIRLWLTYNARLLDEYHRERFPLIDFDQADGGLEATVDRVAASLGLPCGRDRQAFLAPDLRSERASAGSGLPQQAAGVYADLKKAAAGWSA